MSAEIHRYPCEQCGADLRFSPGEAGKAGLVCDHCGHRQSVAPAGRDRLAAMEEVDLALGLANRLPEALIEESRVLSCTSCGAQIEFEGAVHSKECPFCASPVVIGTGTERHIKPQAVIPFALTEDQARAALTRWLGRLWFAPSGVREYARKGRRMTGIYTPFWTFDADTTSRYRGQRGDHYYETRTVRVNVNGKSETRQQRVQKTRWSPASGQVSRHFDDVVVLASTSLPRRYVDSLQPWDMGALQPYRPDFLAGFSAEGYTIDLPQGHATARDLMAGVIQQDVRRAIGGDVQRIDRIDTIHSGETFKHILLPIWMAAYKFRGKSYRFMINGQTGEVQGERPWSPWKIAAAVIIAAAIAAAVAYGIQLNEQGSLDWPPPGW